MPKNLLAVLAVVLPFFAGMCPAEEPKLPEGVDPLPPTMREKMKTLLQSAEKYRGLKCLHNLATGALQEDALRTKMKMMFAEELPPNKMRPLEMVLKTFGFIPETMDLNKYFPELLTSQVGGYYDPRRQYLIIVQREGGLLGKEMVEKLGKKMADRMEETVMVHEMTHAIQDQHFDLKTFMKDDPMSDESAARQALVEGDATLTMYNYFAGMKFEDMPGIDDIISKMMEDPSELMAMTPEMPGAKEMQDAPAWFRDGMLFSYLQGYVFCLKVKKAGGQALLDYAYAKDPPRSTEQVLHPDKWFEKRDDPIEITLPDVSAKLGGATKVAEGTLGELGIKMLLHESIKDLNVVTNSAAGWGGDRYALYEKDGARTLCWVTDWDSEKDASEFAAASAKLGKGWKVETPGNNRVTLTRTNLDAAAVTALHAALRDAKKSTPANNAIDLAMVRKNNKAGDGDAAADGLGKLGELANNPLVKDMLKEMATQKTPEGKISEDGKSYTNEGMGISLKLPESAKGWKLAGKGVMPAILATVSGPDGVAQIQVLTQPLPIEMPIETIGPMLEMGVKMMMTNYKKQKDGFVGEGASKGFELQYTAEPPGLGAPARLTQRMYMRPGKVLVVQSIVPEESWEKNSKAIGDILDAIKLSAPKPAPDAKPKE